MNKIIAILFVICIANARQYTLYKQCDSAWANDQLGTSANTICRAGCLISSIAMMLHTYSVVTDGTTTPKIMNAWLRKNGGYASGDLFVWAGLNQSSWFYKFDAGLHVILNVNNCGHYVLMTSYSGDTFNVNDPGYPRSTYSANEVKEAAYYVHSKITYFKNHVLNI
ncbi:unnamed protein product [Paramecium pentaurelia]|uniref:Peptidase C39-like domain-containing protein n=1 Tax=Paramecium pentaurelia TaxID=43138 RepID=A0A8S1WLR3_9CILI|nr:unnamed protein product [Paramecium pentaurelia]